MLKKENEDNNREVLEMKKLQCIEIITKVNNLIVRELEVDTVSIGLGTKRRNQEFFKESLEVDVGVKMPYKIVHRYV